MHSLKYLALAGLLATSLGTQAASLTSRISFGFGEYNGNNSTVESSGNSETYGFGTTLSAGIFAADLGLDYYQIKHPDGNFTGAFTRTDVTLAAGIRVLSWLGVVAGFREAFQGNSGTFSQDVWRESGYFAGLRFGAFPIGGANLSVQLAYNKNDLELDPSIGGGDIDGYDGLSGKIRLGFADSKHSGELRYQKFEKGSGGFANFEEDYTYLVYIYSLPTVSLGK